MEPTAIWIDKFKVVRKLGRGGMGAVYEGYDPALDRRVAIKTLTSDAIADQDSRNRFEREARAAAKLQHPNIVTIYELGNFGLKEKPYIVMEYLEGQDVASLIDEDVGLPLPEALDIAIQLCHGLTFAHEHGVVHRDVKPSNLRYLDDGRLKIMDFGIARVEGSAQITRSGVMVGTLHYMSPEQIQGDPVDGRSDVFSAGCILYEMLAGRRPFPGETATSILYKIVHEQPPPLLSLHPDLPQEIQTILDRALAKRPADRFQSADEMAREIERLLAVYKKSYLRPPQAIERELTTLSALSKERRWAAVVTAAEKLMKERPDLEEPRRARRQALRWLKQAEYERQTSDAEKTAHLEEISNEFKMLYGPAFAPTMADDAGAATKREGTPAPDPTAGDLMLRSRTATKASPEGRRSTGQIAGITVAIVLVAGLLAWGLWPAPRPTPEKAVSRPVAGGVVAAPLEVRVTSTPSGASVFLNGADTGLKTEARVPLAGKTGETFAIEVRLPGFVSATKQGSIGPQGPEPLDFALRPAAQSATLVTEPKDAQVTLDGKPLSGPTPLELTLSPDEEHTIVVTKEGFSPRTVRLSKGERIPGRIALAPAGKPGVIAVRSDYAVAILSGGHTIAESSTSPQAQLRAGEQVVTLFAPDKFLNREVRVTLTEGATETIQAPGLGKLALKAEPSNCKIVIDGIPSEPPPYFNKDIVAGRHRFEFEWPDGTKQSLSKDVEAGKMTYVTVKK